MGLGSFFKKLKLKKKKKSKPSSPKGVSKPKHGTRSGYSPTGPTTTRHTHSPRSSNQSSPAVAYTAYRPSASVPALGSTTSPTYTPYRPYGHIPPGGVSFGPGSNPTMPPGSISVAGVPSTGTGTGPGAGTGAGYVPNSQLLADLKKDRMLTVKYVRGLNKFGAINVDWATLPALDYGIEGRSEGVKMRKQVPKIKEPDDPIHPCFRRTMFYYISDADYELIKPSLRLVSCYLDDPRIIPFFHGVLHRPMTLHPLLGKINRCELGKAFYTFRERQPKNNAEWMATYKAIAETRKHIDFEFIPISGGVIGLTDRQNILLPDGSVDTSRPRRANIFLHEDFLHILRGNLKPSSILLPDELGEPLDNHAALLRVRFMLGKALLHEFTHAFSHIHFPLDYNIASETYVDEPFYGDHRLAEMGFALEQFINGTSIQTIRGSKRSTVDCAYGLVTMKFPGLMRGHEFNAFELAPPIKYGIGSDTYFAVTMDTVATVFTRAFWNDVARFGGLEAFRPRRDARISHTVMDESVWDQRDSPGFRRVGDEPVGGGYSAADLRP